MRHPATLVLRCLLSGALAAAALLPTGATALTATGLTGAGLTGAGVHGGDISWPNCPKGEGIPSRRTEGQPMPTRGAAFVIVGVTNGPGFFPNPCLAGQVAWVRTHDRLLAAYAMTTYPNRREVTTYGQDGPYDAATARGALRNAAYAEARYNLSTMATAAMTVPMLWVDVEPYPVAPWSKSHSANRAVVTAAVRAYADAGYRVGIYTYPNGWKQVVGKWQLPSLPTWSTVGSAKPGHALKACGHGPSGGPDWVMQWFAGHRDKDLICPAGGEQASLIFATPSS